ncbi:hypothetical protein [Alloprevotella sp. OH1205_COT-284]|nr:hypothetical protein [Alloprevotella sp. OH1205_COT-284]
MKKHLETTRRKLRKADREARQGRLVLGAIIAVLILFTILGMIFFLVS